MGLYPLERGRMTTTNRPKPTGVDTLHSLYQRISGLEARVTELERCKHDTHNLHPDVISQITEMVKQDFLKQLNSLLGAAAPSPETEPESEEPENTGDDIDIPELED